MKSRIVCVGGWIFFSLIYTLNSCNSCGQAKRASHDMLSFHLSHAQGRTGTLACEPSSVASKDIQEQDVGCKMKMAFQRRSFKMGCRCPKRWSDAWSHRTCSTRAFKTDASCTKCDLLMFSCKIIEEVSS